MRESEIEERLKGKTLRVYYYMLLAGRAVGIREVQRKLDFSSPSVAAYHLDKLVELGLAKKESEGYVLEENVHVGVLKYFVFIGRYVFPRYLFYAIFFTTSLITYLLVYPLTLSIHNIAAILFGLLASLITWFETYRCWRQKPF
ncbi:MAG: winged helix-turn-helix domain-containing protein [Candidatus Baldrarchaeia archaeon]